MEAKTDPPTPTSVGQSGKAGAMWAGWTLLVPAQRLPEPGCARQLPPLPRARGAQPAVGVGEEVLSEGCPAWSGSYLTGECGWRAKREPQGPGQAELRTGPQVRVLARQGAPGG